MNVQGSEFPNGYIIQPDGDILPMPEPAGDDGGFTLEQLQEAVKGYVAVLFRGPTGNLFLCNEDGMLQHQPYNMVGTILCGKSVVGNVVVIDAEAMK